MIRFIHTGDVHFGMENYGKIDPQTGIHSRLLDFAKAFNACIDHAIAHDVDFFLFCGDAYKTAHPSQTQQRLLMQCLLRLYKANIPVVIVVGNHDHPLSFGKTNALEIFGELPLDGFHVISKPTTINLTTKNGPVNIVGIPWPTRNTISLRYSDKSATKITEYIAKAVTHIIADLAKNLDPSIPAVLASHMTVSSGIFSGSEKRAIYGNDPTFLPSQLAINPFDYVALGHLHRHQNLNPNGIPIVYAGSIERIDFGERKEPKGFCIVTIKDKQHTEYSFVESPTRPFIQIEVKLQPGIPQTEQIIAAIKRYDITDAVIKIVYYVPDGKKDSVDLKTIQACCQHAMHLVGIIPIINTPERQRRTGAFKVGADIHDLLTHYFNSKPEFSDKKEQLLEKTFELLEQEAESDED